MSESPSTSPSATTQFISFDGTETVESKLFQPDRYSSLYGVLKSENKLSILGAGLSLTLASARQDGATVSSKSFNRVIDFNSEKLEVTVEAGIRIGDLLSFLIQNDCWISPLPGHPNISVGGCIGFNIHGKSRGFFHEIIKKLIVFHPKYGEQVIFPEASKDLFQLTLGGAGLTGFITEVTLQVSRLPGFGIKKKSLKTNNLVEAVEMLSAKKSAFDQVYSWNDLTPSKLKNFGRGYLYCESFTNEAPKPTQFEFYRMTANGRGHQLSSILSPLMGRKINWAYEFREQFSGETVTLGAFQGAFPISGSEIYFHLFGKAGYRESQLAIPLENWKPFVEDLFAVCKQIRPDVTLGSLKLFENSYDSYLNFCSAGVILAINVVANKKSLEFFSHLDELVIKHNGLPNVYKDSRLSNETIQATYGQRYNNFAKDAVEFDPDQTFSSEFLKRVLP